MLKESAVRDRILDVAARLFYQQGYNLTGINQIIDEAAIARGSLYNHFPSKTDLLLAYITRENDAWFAGFEAFSRNTRDPKQKILKLFDYRAHLQESSGFGGCHFVKINAEVSREEKKVFELVTAHKERQRSYIRQLVARLHSGDAGSQDLLSDTIFLLLEGGGIGTTIYQDTWALKKAKKIVNTLL